VKKWLWTGLVRLVKEIVSLPLDGGHLDVYSDNRKLTRYVAMGFLDGWEARR
jgi:hypothetical protein